MATRRKSTAFWLCVATLVGSGAVGACAKSCNDSALDATPSASSAAPGGLTPELAAKVVAKVGDREITLGEYAATIERMDQFERLRYQSADRRRQLLDEIIKVELLAAEAKRRGLDKQPETQERVRQILRDELLRRERADLPPPGTIPEAEVRAYYAKHRDDFREPERRRVAHIVMKDEAEAKKVLAQALKATPMEWGRLVNQHSLDKPAKASPTAPLELAGDLGIVSKPGEKRGDNSRVTAEVRKALFQIDKVGSVYSEVVRSGDEFHIVRMTGKTDARDRSFAEAERTIRVAILQDKIEQSEKKLEADLRKRFSVKVDDAALSKVSLPAGGGGDGAGSDPN